MDKLIPLEDEEQKAFVGLLRIKKLLHFSLANGAVLSGNAQQRARQMKKLKATGLLTGASDIVVLIKDKILFIEMKRRPKKLKSGKLSVSHTQVSKEQKEFIKSVNTYGYAEAIVCYGAKQAIEFVNKELRD